MKQNQTNGVVEITPHAQDRLKTRLNVKSSNKRLEITQKAYQVGKRLSQASGEERRYIMANVKDIDKYKDREIALYQDRLWVFEDNLLITVLPSIPSVMRLLQYNRAVKSGKIKKHYCVCEKNEIGYAA